MRKTIIAASLASAALALPGLALAQAAAPLRRSGTRRTRSPATVGLFSDYRFRGIDQTFGKPAIQGGFDLLRTRAASTLGNWNSNVNSGAGYPGGNIEMDFYGGWKKTWGDWGLDVGAIYYYYPGTNASRDRSPSAATTGTATRSQRQGEQQRDLHRRQLEVDLAEVLHAISDYFSCPNTNGLELPRPERELRPGRRLGRQRSRRPSEVQER